MPISSSTTRSSYNGDGSTVAFAVGFVYFDDDHVRVVHVDSTGTETVWTRGSEYTLSGDGAAGTGQVDVDTSPTDYTPASGETLVVRLFPPQTQDVELPSGNYLDDIERAIDILLQQVLRLQDGLNRAVAFAEGSSTTGKTMPEPEDGKVIAWDGTALTNLAPNTSAYLTLPSVATDSAIVLFDGVTGAVIKDSGYVVSAAGAALIYDANAAAQRATLGLVIGTNVQAYDENTMVSDTSTRITANQGFTPAADASSSGAVTFDFSTGNICKITLTEAITSVTIDGADAGDTLKIWITQAAGGYAVSGWASTVKWAGGGTAPTISTTSGAVDIITLEYDGTNYYAAISQDHQ